MTLDQEALDALAAAEQQTQAFRALARQKHNRAVEAETELKKLQDAVEVDRAEAYRRGYEDGARSISGFVSRSVQPSEGSEGESSG